MARQNKRAIASTSSSAAPGTSFDNALYFASPAAFNDWLAAHYNTHTELFVGFHKKHTGNQTMTWSESVDEALCWGWIDGHARSVDANRTARRFTPRAKKSHWSRVNVDKFAALETAGRIHEPGRAAFARRTEDNTAQAYFERQAHTLSDEFAARLAANSEASEYLEGRAAGYRRQVYDWVMSAKRPETQERRLTELIDSSAQQIDVKPFRR
ncbi:Bacteriocin-protection protein [Mycena indigotica]|uniref:Bacteriocin-protection protein n=1 Tax=Mycena indigotica TaxID=2126181 RepID=A0A8H6SLU7_9AGAR|nr:Bacteriocin-protection protein [Mycena indigotica]KAF7301016.1 Bacteriocin-protection protein [Mycena indigotica]